MKKGDIVKFKTIVDAGDEKALMVIEEERGDRVLVRHLVNMALQPTSVYPLEDLEPVMDATKAEELYGKNK